MMTFFKKKWVIAVLAVVVLVVGFSVFGGNGNGVDTVKAKYSDVVRTVSVSGKVIPAEEVKLAFETGGIVAQVLKDVGDKVYAGETIAILDQSELNADLLKAEADLESALVALGNAGGIDLAQSSEVELKNAKRALVQSIVDAYTTADDGVRNRVDQFFENPRSPLPDLIPWIDDRDFEDDINDTRYDIELMLRAWNTRVLALNTDTYKESDLITAQANISKILIFLDDVSNALSGVDATDDMPQTTIDKYRTDVASARSNINTAAADLVQKGNALEEVISGVPTKSASVKGYEANLVGIRAKLAKTVLRSPINGIVSLQDLKVGEAVSANAHMVSVISENYEIEAFIPEVSIAGVAVGNSAEVTLDAYGDDVAFNATVLHIDPAETIKDGVSTYKMHLAFSVLDSRVRSGMTANIMIETFKKSDVLTIPLRTIQAKEDGTKVVYVKNNGGYNERIVEIGESDSKGNVEVISGVTDKDVIRFEPIGSK